MKKGFLSVMLAITLALSMTACSDKGATCTHSVAGKVLVKQ